MCHKGKAIIWKMRTIVNIIFRQPETFAKLVDVSSVQSYSGTSNRRHNKQKGYDFERKPNKEICHRYSQTTSKQ